MAELSLQIPWITLTVFLPAIGAVFLAMVPAEHKSAHRALATIFMSATFLVSLVLLGGFNSEIAGYQLTTVAENVEWIPALGARYHVGVDGISIWLIILTTFLGPIITLSGFKYIDKHVKEYHIALLMLQTAMLGAFVALDLLLYYIFWELMLVPMYLLVGVWGGKDRIYAAVKLFLYTMVGSVLMLIAILYVYAKGGMQSFDYATMAEAARSLSAIEQRWLFAAFALAFLIKVPLFPFHTWLPDAHVQAPTAGSVILASVLLKMGTYGMIRYAMPLFPDATFFWAPYIALLSVIGIFYGAVIAYVQTDVKKLIAYSSVSHLGFVTLGLVAMTEASIMGAMFQNLAHGVTTGGLFLGIGILYERRHTRDIDEFGGLAKQMPLFATFYVILALGSAGVPGLVGFAGEFMILTGSSASYALNFGQMSYFIQAHAFGPDIYAFVFVGLAATGVIFGALYLLHVVQKVFFGPITKDENRELPDLSPREIGYMLPMVLLCFFMGLRPQLFIEKMDASVEHVVDYIEEGANERAYMAGDDQNRDTSQFGWQRMYGTSLPWRMQNQLEELYADHHGDDEHHDEEGEHADDEDHAEGADHAEGEHHDEEH